MAQVKFEKKGLMNFINKLKNHPIDVFKLYNSKGVLQLINSNNATANLPLQILIRISHDIGSVVQLLEMRIINYFFLKKLNAKFNQSKTTYDISWILDLKNQFNDKLIFN